MGVSIFRRKAHHEDAISLARDFAHCDGDWQLQTEQAALTRLKSVFMISARFRQKQHNTMSGVTSAKVHF